MTKNTRVRERKCRKNIANMLSLMGFEDNNTSTAAVTVRNMLAELRQNQENNNGRHKLSPTTSTAADAAGHNNKNRSTNKQLVLKLGGKRHLFDKKSPTSVIVSHEDDAIMELTKADNMEILNSSSSRMNVGDDIEVLRSANNVVVHSENPNLEMIIHNELRVDNVKDFITSIGGTKAKLFIEKKLTDTDVQKHQGRLLMPARQLVDKSDNLLTSNEKMILRNDNQLSVTVFDPQTNKWDLNLGQWKMGSNINYVLKTKWYPLAEKNELKQHMKIQLWSFRDVKDKLCLAVVLV